MLACNIKKLENIISLFPFGVVSLLLLVNHHNARFVINYLFVGLDVEVLQYLSLFSLIFFPNCPTHKVYIYSIHVQWCPSWVLM